MQTPLFPNLQCWCLNCSRNPHNPREPKRETGAAWTGGETKSNTMMLLPRQTRRHRQTGTWESFNLAPLDMPPCRWPHLLGRTTWACGRREAPLLCQRSGCRGGGSCPGPHDCQGRGSAGWERKHGELAPRKLSAVEGHTMTCPNPFSQDDSVSSSLSFPAQLCCLELSLLAAFSLS